MTLRALLYRCPLCGHQPVMGEKDEVRCGACGGRFQRGERGGTLEVIRGGVRAEEPVAQLVAAVEEQGGALPGGVGDGLRYSARVRCRSLVSEEPVWFRGTLRGFAESMGPWSQGELTITDRAITFESGGDRQEWALEALKAVQTSSSSVQFVPPEGGLFEFRFEDDSPRRWEELLRSAVSRAHRAAGRGDVLEFQPRIVLEGDRRPTR